MLSWGYIDITQKNEVNISNGDLAVEFFLHICLKGGVERVDRERVVEILTIIMLTQIGWIGLGYGFGVEQFLQL